MTHERVYSETTKKLLWARSRNLCAFPGCRQKITERTEGTGSNVILGEIAHIIAINDDGPRADPQMPIAERNYYDNLIVLCPTHHKLVDSAPNEYTAERLRAWKRNHEGTSVAWTEEVQTSVERAAMLGGWYTEAVDSAALLFEAAGVAASFLQPEDQIQLVQTVMHDIEADIDKASLRSYCRNLHSPGSFPYRSLFQSEDHSALYPGDLSNVYVAPYLEMRKESLVSNGPPARIRLIDVLEAGGDVATGPNHLRLLGEAGCGKSTLLRMTQLQVACQLRLNTAPTRLVPILVRLQALALEKGTFETRLWRAIESAKDLVFDCHPPEGYFSKWPEVGDFQWLLLLDGLDEIDAREFGGLQAWLMEALHRVHNVVITSRPSSTLVDWLADRVHDVYHLGFDSDRCLLLAHNLLGDAAAEFIQKLNQLVFLSLAENPLMVTLAAALYKRHGALLPKTSLQLYDQVIKLFLQELEERGGRDELPDELLAFSKPILEELAYHMTTEPSNVKVEELVPLVARRLASDLGRPFALMSRPSYAERLVRFLGKRSGTFTCIGNAAGWSHGTFREYLCAKFVEERPASDPLVTALLEPDRSSKELIQMLLWVSRFNSDIALQLLSLPDLFAANAILVVESLCEGNEISAAGRDLAISRVEQRLLTNCLGNYCASMLTTGLPASMCATLLARLFAARPDAFPPERRERLIEGLLAKARTYEELQWDFPSVFMALSEMGARNELRSLVEDDSCPPYARLIAAKLSEHPDTQLVGNLINQLAAMPGFMIHDRITTYLASGPQLIAAVTAENTSPKLALAVPRLLLQQAAEPGEQIADSAQAAVIRAWAEGPATSAILRFGALVALTELMPLDPNHDRWIIELAKLVATSEGLPTVPTSKEPIGPPAAEIVAVDESESDSEAWRSDIDLVEPADDGDRRQAYPTEYPIPMYCRKEAIHGLYSVQARAKDEMNRHGPSAHAIVLLEIDSPENIFGLCNFKYDDEDDYNLKFSEKWWQLEAENIAVLVRSFRVTRFIVPEPSLRLRVEKVLRSQCLNAFCE